MRLGRSFAGQKRFTKYPKLLEERAPFRAEEQVVTGAAHRGLPQQKPPAGHLWEVRVKLNGLLNLAVSVVRRSYCCQGGSSKHWR